MEKSLRMRSNEDVHNPQSLGTIHLAVLFGDAPVMAASADGAGRPEPSAGPVMIVAAGERAQAPAESVSKWILESIGGFGRRQLTRTRFADSHLKRLDRAVRQHDLHSDALGLG